MTSRRRRVRRAHAAQIAKLVEIDHAWLASFTRPRGRRLPAQGAGSPGHCCRRLITDLSPGKVRGLGRLPAQALEGGFTVNLTCPRSAGEKGESLPCPRALRNPTAAYFLFDTAFLWIQAREKRLKPAGPARDAKRMPSKIRNARWVRCQGAGTRHGPRRASSLSGQTQGRLGVCSCGRGTAFTTPL